MRLHDGERFAGRGSVADPDGMTVLAAAVDTPIERRLAGLREQAGDRFGAEELY